MTDSALPNHPPDTPPASSAPRIAGQSLRAVAFFLAVTALVTAADLYLKYWSFENVAGIPVVLTEQVVDEHQAFWSQYPHEPIVIVPEVLNLQLTTNTGAVFGLGKGGRLVFILISVLATAIILVMFYRSRADAWLLHVALAMILAGGVGEPVRPCGVPRGAGHAAHAAGHAAVAMDLQPRRRRADGGCRAGAGVDLLQRSQAGEAGAGAHAVIIVQDAFPCSSPTTSACGLGRV